MVVTTFKEYDFVLPKFDLKLELADRTVSDDVKRIFDATDTILIKPDKMLALSDLKYNYSVRVKRLRKALKRHS